MDEIRETALSYRSGKCTYEDYAELPEGAPYQLIGGELVVAPSPDLALGKERRSAPRTENHRVAAGQAKVYFSRSGTRL